MVPQNDSSEAYQRALELVYAGRVNRNGVYCEIPTNIFVGKVDVGMPPLPPISFYQFRADGSLEQIRTPDQPYSALALSAMSSVWVHESTLSLVRSFTETAILSTNTSAGASSGLSTEKRMESLRRSAILVCEDLFQNPSPENISKSVKMVGSFVYVIMKDPKAYTLLTRLSSHDPYTLQHSVGTAVHCVILGRKVGISDEKELTELGTAGLLHDIGKTQVKPEIINKQGPLDDLEWEEMRTHPGAGYEIVKNNPELSERTKRAILEHHEDKNGTGYPLRRRIVEVDIFSRIVCICDVFNALTTDRSYSKARTPFEALQFMKEKISHKLDDELYRQLVMIYGGKLV